MVQSRKLETAGFVLSHVIFEHRESDIYKLEDSALAAASLLLNERPTVTGMPQVEDGLAERVKYAPSVESEAGSEFARVTQVKFRQASIEVDDPGDFWDGVVGGQIAIVEEQRPLTSALVFELFEDAVRDLEFSETWLAGYLLGLSDALLRHRKIYPREYAALLKPLKNR